MSATALVPRLSPIAIAPRQLLFSLSSLIAAAATLGIVFVASLPRPWWALLTVYVTAQPMAGAFRPKLLYRLAGIAVGAAVTLAVVPNLQNAPELLVLAMACWTGLCIYLAVLDRTPRAFLFQMAAFSAAVMTFPYLDDPGAILFTTVARVQEMAIAIVCVTAAHAVLQPWSATPAIAARAGSFLAHAARWTAEALAGGGAPLEPEHRRALAADVTELGMLAVHLPFDQRGAAATRRAVLALQERLGAILPLGSAAADRLEQLRRLGPLDPPLARLVSDMADWLRTPPDGPDAATVLIDRCRALSATSEQRADWRALLTFSACERMAGLVDTLRRGHALAARLGNDSGSAADAGAEVERVEAFPLARDHHVAATAGIATGAAIILYCAVWILLAWTSGSATAAFAALITCSFALQDDPAPVIGRYLVATLATFPLAAFYLFVVLPRVDGYEMLVVVLAPALLVMGYLQADPARSALALPMFSCFIVAMGFLDRFQADFATFANTGLAQLGGIVATLTVTRLFRSVDARRTARRIIRGNWTDLSDLADIRRPFRPQRWTARAIDRLGQIAARMALAAPDDALHAADGLADLRVGRNVIPVRRALAGTPHDVRHTLGQVLAGVAALFRARRRAGVALDAPPALLDAIDRAIAALRDGPAAAVRREALLALVGMRCNLFGQAAPFQGEPAR